MPAYETALVLSHDLSIGQVEDLVTGALKHFPAQKATLARQEYWGLRSMAYRIRRNRRGHYVLLNYESEPQAAEELERFLRLSADCLRFMTIRTEKLPEGDSIMLRRIKHQQAEEEEEQRNRAARVSTREDGEAKDPAGASADPKSGGEREAGSGSTPGADQTGASANQASGGAGGSGGGRFASGRSSFRHDGGPNRRYSGPRDGRESRDTHGSHGGGGVKRTPKETPAAEPPAEPSAETPPQAQAQAAPSPNPGRPSERPDNLET